MNQLMLHCGGQPASLDEIRSVQVPAATRTYQPLPHGDMYDLIVERFGSVLDRPVRDQAFGLARKGAQLFGVVTFDVTALVGSNGGTVHGLAVGLRNSYDLSMSAGCCVGAKVFVCDNYAFSGDALTILRKHTLNVLRDLTAMVGQAAEVAAANYRDVAADFRRMAEIEIGDDQAHAALGQMYGRGILRVRQLTRAYERWEDPGHDELPDKTAWRLYNACTEGLKLAHPREALDSYTGLHSYMLGMANAA